MAARTGGFICAVMTLTAAIGFIAGEGKLFSGHEAPQAASHSSATSNARTAGNGSPDEPLKTQFMWNARVTVADGIVLGKSKHGWRRVVPITGGSFEGPNIRGEVMPGGEDWQLYRPDGDTELCARYLLKTPTVT
jgi:hypothetical protein